MFFLSCLTSSLLKWYSAVNLSFCHSMEVTGSTVAQKPLQLPLADKLNILFALTDEIHRAVTNIDFLC